jgi:hypothetical protein
MRTTTNISSYGPTLSEAKNYLRVDINEDDALISALITASYDQVTAECNRDFSACTHSMYVFSSSGDIFVSTQTVNTVSTGSLKEYAGSWYTYIPEGEYFTGNIIFTVASGSIIPTNVKVAQMMLINSFYENRLPESVGVSTSPLSYSVQALLSPYKLIKPQ